MALQHRAGDALGRFLRHDAFDRKPAIGVDALGDFELLRERRTEESARITGVMEGENFTPMH